MPAKSQGRSGKKPTEGALRKAVVHTAQAMSRSGLSPGRSGNVSCRWKSGMLITPSGLRYEELGPDDIVHVRSDGSLARKQRRPSSEWQLHLACYRARPDMSALVHAHSLNATALACAHKSIPAFHYMVAIAGGHDIPLVPYATFGSEALAEKVAEAVKSRTACLMANHGQIALGTTLKAALELAGEVEVLAEQFVKVLTLGPPRVISDAEMAVVLEKFGSYGQKAQE